MTQIVLRLIQLYPKVETAIIRTPWLEAFHFFSCLFVRMYLSWQIRPSWAWMMINVGPFLANDPFELLLSLIAGVWHRECFLWMVTVQMINWVYHSFIHTDFCNFPVQQTWPDKQHQLVSVAYSANPANLLILKNWVGPENLKYTEEKANCSLIRTKKCTGCTVCWSLSQWDILWGPAG